MKQTRNSETFKDKNHDESQATPTSTKKEIVRKLASQFKDEIERGNKKELLPVLIKNLINIGLIDPANKTGEQLLEESLACLIELSSDRIVADHTTNLLEQARLYQKSSSNGSSHQEMACVLYAMWIEHILNNFVSTLAFRKKMSSKEVEMLIRDTSYRAKSTWLLRIFNLDPIDEDHLNAINKIMELRNSFVHYKWKPINKQTKQEIQVALDKVEDTVQYLKSYESKYLDRITVTQVEEILKSN